MRLNASQLSHRAIPSIAAPSPAGFLDDWVAPRRPVILKGMAGDASPLRRWSPEALRAQFGSMKVPVARTLDGRVVADPKRGVLRDVEPLSDYIDRMLSKAASGYLTARADELPIELRRELAAPPYCGGAPWLVCKLWVAAAGTVSALHRDLAENLHLQVHGSKRFILVAPEDNDRVYPSGLLSSIPNGSRVDVENPDFERFPKLRDARLHVAELQAGDAVYIPHYWWHHVRTIEASISVNWFFASGALAGVAFAADVAKRLRGISR